MRERRLVLDIVAVSECSFGARKRCLVRNKLCLADRCRIADCAWDRESDLTTWSTRGRPTRKVRDAPREPGESSEGLPLLSSPVRIVCASLICWLLLTHSTELQVSTRGPTELQHDRGVFKIDVQQRATKQTVGVYLLEGRAKPE